MKFDRNAIEIPRYAAIERGLSDATGRIISDLQRGSISKAQAIGRFKDSLIEHETAAFVAGRRARGDLRSNITPAEERMLETRHSRNMNYFRGFADDVVAGRGQMNYHRRAGLYGKSLWSIFTRGESSNWSDPDDYSARYHWVLDPDAEHCSSENPDRLGCIQRAQRSYGNDGFSWEELSELGWPGEASPCGVNCRCHIRVVRKALALPSELGKIPPSDTPEDGLNVFQAIMGGPEYPEKLPAAGIPYVSVPPAAITSSMQVAGDQAPELARMLPTVPKTLVKPDGVVEKGDVRVYAAPGLVAAVQRSLAGIWELALLALTGQKPKEQGS